MDPCISILNVRASFPFKGYHGFKVKVISVSTVCLQVVEFNCTNTDCMCHFFLVFKFRIFFFDLRFGTRDGFLKSWFKQDDISFTSRQFLAVLCHQTKVNVHHIIAPVKSHFLQHSFQLTEVVRLFLPNGVDVLDKVVSPCTVHSCCDITSDIKSGTV